MSRQYSRHAQKSRGHGALGFTLTFILVILVLLLVFLFAADSSMKGAKGKIFSVFYPHKYEQQVQQSAAEFGVDENLIYAVMRTESGFRPDVESHAGAIGLMQIMPSTFDWLQERLDGEVIYTSDALTDPDINIRYGTYLLSILLEEYDGNLQTAVAAYNAGTTTVNGWLEDSEYSSDGKTLTTIPYEETEKYVARVMKAYDLYRQLYY